jgi:negative regulator of flagellin synthesis FlgM
MKIGNINSTAPATAVSSDRKTAGTSQDQKAPTATATAADSSTQVELSPEASLLSAASADPSFDSAKVDRIAQAIKDGKFTVNHGAIADKLIANAQELLGRASKSH